MRIITGSLKGRRLELPKNLKARPTTDFAKTGLFNVLQNLVEFNGLKVLDLFSGTGSISFEFVSRGAASVTSVDIEPAHCKAIQQNADRLDLKQMRVLRRDVFAFLEAPGTGYDLVFADPPYDMPAAEQLPDIILQNGMLNDGGWFVLEHSSRVSYDEHPHLDQTRKYGSVAFSFFSAGTAETDSEE